MTSTTPCPICGSDAMVLPRIGDFEGFDCRRHHRFNVSDTALQIRRGKASVEHWERSWERAKLRTESGEAPMIKDDDFL
jgi:hypothetical protein